jgi:hypothetical protein
MKIKHVFCVALLFLASCAPRIHHTNYDAKYIKATDFSNKLSGEVLIFTTHEDDQYIFTGQPTSFTGSARTISIPLGKITKEIAIEVFRNLFQSGLHTSNVENEFKKYSLVIRPRITSYSYEYNQLKNAGIAITPEVIIRLHVDLHDNSNGKVYFSKDYDSGVTEGDTYIMTYGPEEKINKVTHEVVYKLMQGVAEDVISLKR